MSAGAVRALLERHGLEPRRSMGQNFMVDHNTIERIAAASHVGPGDRVVEIGPGLGALTTALAGTGAEIIAIEADRAILPVLDDVLTTAGIADRVRVIHADTGEVQTHLIVLAGHLGVPVRGLDRLQLGIDIDLLQVIDKNDGGITIDRDITGRDLDLEPVVVVVAAPVRTCCYCLKSRFYCSPREGL